MSVRRRKAIPSAVREAAIQTLESRVLLIATADLLISVDATGLPEGPLTSIANTGPLGGVFEARGGGDTVPVIGRPLAASTVGTRGIRLDGNDYMQLVQAVGGALITAPAGLTTPDPVTGESPTRSVEAWVWNPGIAGEETVIAWGRRGGPDGTNASFNYGNHGTWGAIGHWGAPDIGWGPTVPAARQWHHLAWTFDGPTSTTRVYFDGALANEEVLAPGAINTHPDTPINIASQTEPDGVTPTGGLRGSMTIGKLRVHDGVLTPEQILANYEEERAAFVEPNDEPPPPPPAVLLVDVNATALPDGPITSIPNAGPAGGAFAPTEGGDTVPVIGLPLEDALSGTKGIRLDGNDFLQHVDQFGAPLPADPDLVGVDPARSIEVWVWNPSVAGEETMVSWGRRGGPDGSNMSFNYGSSPDFGAVGHWGSPDIGWGTTPPARQWHHLVYTYDRTTTRVYVDGVLANSELLGEGTINTHAGFPINIGTQLNAAGLPEPGLRGTLTLGRVKVYEGVLTDAQIAANHTAERPTYVEPGLPPPPDPTPLTAPPVHRYSFNAAAGDASGAQITDSIGGAHGTVIGPVGAGAAPTWTGTRLVLPGGPSAEAPYGDLPNQLLSKFGSINGGTGQVTIEGWVRHTGSQPWSRFYDFGNSTAGELSAPGGTGNGTTYHMLTAQTGANTAVHRFEVQASPGNPANRFQDVDSATFNTDLHFVATWQEARVDPETGEFFPGELKLYEQGLEVAEFTSPVTIGEIFDVNNWLGRSNYTADANFQGEFDEFRIYDRVITPGEARGNFEAGADVINTGGGVTQVYVRGTAWANAANASFMTFLEQSGAGDDVLGYRVDNLTGAAPTLPWINVDQVVLRYSAPPTGGGIPQTGTVTLDGVRADYTVTSVVQIDPRTFALVLDRPLGNLPGGGNDGDRVAVTVADGGPGNSDYRITLNPLQGDADRNSGRVTALDLAFVKARQNRTAAETPPAGLAAYSPFADFDTNGRINAIDLAAVKARQNDALPPAPASSDVFSDSSITREVLSA